MTVRRFVQDPVTLELVEADSFVEPDRRGGDRVLWGDSPEYAGLRATDGTDISTRSRHRDYMRRNGLTTVDDFQGEFTKAQQRRNDIAAGIDPNRKRDIRRAIEKLANQRR